ncbi:MAG: hypothetical protein IT318_12135 [Anaerolineales bacterium]|nr:hypothetical protein [Anaerolineales bacterium]
MGAHTPEARGAASVLADIRQAETEISRRVAAEQEAAADRLAEARRTAAARLEAAEAEGRQEGEQRRQGARLQAERDAAEIVARAQRQSAILQRAGEAALAAAVKLALQVVLEDEHAA